MTTFEDADVAGDADGAKPLGYGQAVDGYSECGSDMCYVDAVTSGGEVEGRCGLGERR